METTLIRGGSVSLLISRTIRHLRDSVLARSVPFLNVLI
eukprot:SAG11_NODE_3448_length_2441_cov_3.742101_3_plen_39_part_00